MTAIALYQPDIPQNAGNILRLAACEGVTVHIIGPAGFDLSDRALRRAGMDYLTQVDLTRHVNWRDFMIWRSETGSRVVLLTTQTDVAYTDMDYADTDVLLLGRESSGVPPTVHAAADTRVTIPMRPGLRSLNVSTAAAMVLGEALRQTGGFPPI